MGKCEGALSALLTGGTDVAFIGPGQAGSKGADGTVQRLPDRSPDGRDEQEK